MNKPHRNRFANSGPQPDGPLIGHNHPSHERWKAEVAADDTLRGFADWLLAQRATDAASLDDEEETHDAPH